MFIKEVECKGIIFQIYKDDYSQSYHLAWRNSNTDEISTWCCGTYNDYKLDIEDIADYIKEHMKGENNE